MDSPNKTSSDGLDDPADQDSRDDSQNTPQEPPRNQDLEKNEPEEKDEDFRVKFDENERTNPRNWSNMVKAWITLQLGFLA